MGNYCSCDKEYNECELVKSPRADRNDQHSVKSKTATAAGMSHAASGDETSTVALQLDEEEDLESEENDDDVVDNMPTPPTSYNRMPRQSVSAECYGEWNKRGNFKPPVFPKTDEQKSRIIRTIGDSFLFSHLEEDELNTVINAFVEMKIAADVTIIRQGDDGDKLYLIEAGEVDVFKKLAGKEEEQFMCKMSEGDAFGELALMYNAPRAATVKSVTAMQLWVLDRGSFNHIVKEGAARKREVYEGFLKEVHILKDMDPYERSKVADALKAQSFADGETIIQEGAVGDSFYILVEGKATALKEGRVVMNYTKGDYFGELALIKNQPRAATIKSDGGCKVIGLHRKSFKRLLGPLEAILMRNMESYKKVCQQLGLDTEYLERIP